LNVLSGKGDVKKMFAGAAPYLMLWGYTAGGWMMARAALVAASKTGDAFYDTKLKTARYYADHVLPKAAGYAHEVVHGGPSTMALSEDEFDVDRRSLALA
jgi:3-(methylthio)propanoyl-CoA dehydrogenase